MPLPSATFDPTKTVISLKSYLTFTPIVGGVSGTAVSLIGKVADYDQGVETVQRDAVDANNLIWPDRIRAIRQNERIKFEVEELALLVGIFGANKISGHASGTVQFWWYDPDRTSGNVPIKTNAFACAVQMEGGIPLRAEVARATLVFEALAAIVWTFDAVA